MVRKLGAPNRGRPCLFRALLNHRRWSGSSARRTGSVAAFFSPHGQRNLPTARGKAVPETVRSKRAEHAGEARKLIGPPVAWGQRRALADFAVLPPKST